MEEVNHREFLRSIPAEERVRLTRKSNAAGLARLGAHAGLIVAIAVLIAVQFPFWWLLLLPQGILIAFLFTLQHECTHKTPFASETLNEWSGHACGLLIVQPFLWFRYFHLAHHRYTNDPDNDPELAGLPKPNDWSSFCWHLLTPGYWGEKAKLLWTNAFGTIDASYLPASTRGRIRREARLLLAIYAGFLVFTLFVSDFLVWAWLVPVALGFPFLRLYLLAEHGRCPAVANMFDNTRTTYTNLLVRFLAWNMPYHVEHHVLPQVPFHLLPRFNQRIREWLKHTSPGYVAFSRDYVSRFPS